jgi:predicted ferric reductase
MFYICGPIRMTRSLVNEMQKLNIPPQNYKIV